MRWCCGTSSRCTCAARNAASLTRCILSSAPTRSCGFAIGFAAVAFKNRFRMLSIATFVLLLLPAVFAFRYAPALDAGQATPGLGLAERASQYGYQIWQAALALALLRRAL